MEYYYFSASLPSLSMDSAPPFSCETFCRMCVYHLSDQDLRDVRNLSGQAAPEGEGDFLKRWRENETGLRNALVKMRAARLGKDASAYVREQNDCNPECDRTAAEAFSRTSPLEKEQVLDRYRWKEADRLAGLDPFSSSAIMAYAVKLRIAERWASMNDEKGAERADIIINMEPAAGSGAGTKTREQELPAA